MDNNKIYGGIYTSGPSKKTDGFVMDDSQLNAEKQISKYYLLETLAHNYMLASEKLIPAEASKKIIAGLLDLINSFDENTFVNPEFGDVHENTERKLKEMIGEEAGWVHVGRSRNDQVTTDQKLFLKSELHNSISLLIKLVEVFLSKSHLYKDTKMSGFTHMRVATPSTFGFWWQAYASQLLDELSILQRICEVQDKSPLGAGTSYGVNWPINPELTASLLGFSKPFVNALGEINSRGINEIHVLSSFSSILTILSRMMEDIIIWSMPELNFIGIGEEFTTGSSIMPQKMNPDIAEKVRSKVSNTVGHLLSVLISIKGTPSGYNRDSADTKIAITRGIKEFNSTIEIVTAMSDKIVANTEEMKKPIRTALATKLADELCKQFQIPFRKTHEIIGSSIKKANGNVEGITKEILEASILEVIGENLKISEDFIADVFDIDKSLDQYTYKGSPSPASVEEVSNEIEQMLEKVSAWNKQNTENFENSTNNLLTVSRKYCE